MMMSSDYSHAMRDASTLEVHDYVDNDNDDAEESFAMSHVRWPKGPLRAHFHTPAPPIDAAHALSLYKAGIVSHPDHPQAHVWCAQAARLCGGDLARALEYCTRSITMRRSSDGYYVYAHILLLLGQTKEAELAAWTAFEIDGWRPKVRHALKCALMAVLVGSGESADSDIDITDNRHNYCAQCDPLCPTIEQQRSSNNNNSTRKIFLCGRCGNAGYCSRECQIKAWKHHKIYCESKSKIDRILLLDKDKAAVAPPHHKRVMDGWELPSLRDVASVFGASRDTLNMFYNPPVLAQVCVEREEYERRATIANSSAQGYRDMQYYNNIDSSTNDNNNSHQTVTEFRNVNIRLPGDDTNTDSSLGYDPDAYRAARTAFLKVKHQQKEHDDSDGGCAWDVYCDKVLSKRQVYVFLTTDYVDALADYLRQRLDDYGINDAKVLEVGAGNGRLAFFLRQRGIPIVATDDNSWQLDHETNINDEAGGEDNNNKTHGDFSVHNLPCEEALATHKPSIVICAWMPMYRDFTKDFCECPSVREYILIGPVPFCGHAFDTWGLGTITENNNTDKPSPSHLASHVKHGFKAKSLVALERLQLCKTDRPTEMFASRTVSFRREADQR